MCEEPWFICPPVPFVWMNCNSPDLSDCEVTFIWEKHWARPQNSSKQMTHANAHLNVRMSEGLRGI